ncbi:hypothetical protein QEN19_004088 [Hanseniaspora menglaensis]
MSTNKIVIKKCCGLKQISDIEFILANNDTFKYTHLGIILVPNKARSFPLENSSTLKSLVESYGKQINIVGVFQKQSFDEIDKIVSESALPLTHIQIHDSASDWFETILLLQRKHPNLKYIKRFVFPKDCELLNELINTDTFSKQLPELRSKLHILFDSEKGGNGELQDWRGINAFLNKTISDDDSKNFKIIIAGGLTPENVAACINQIEKINGVDVSGGLENKEQVGVKNRKKVEIFAKSSDF